MAIATSNEVLISADSHVSEDPNLWVDRLPAKFTDVAPKFPDRRQNVGNSRFA